MIWGGDPGCKHEWSINSRYWDNRHVSVLASEGKDDLCSSKDSRGHIEGSFCVKCRAWKGQLGLEPTPFQYVEHIVMVFQEIKRILKKSGSVYVVLGDTYAGSCSQGSQSKSQPYLRLYPQRKVLQPKCLIGIPWRVALALIDDDRDDIYELKKDLSKEEREFILNQLRKFKFSENKKDSSDNYSIQRSKETERVFSAVRQEMESSTQGTIQTENGRVEKEQSTEKQTILQEILLDTSRTRNHKENAGQRQTAPQIEIKSSNSLWRQPTNMCMLRGNSNPILDDRSYTYEGQPTQERNKEIRIDLRVVEACQLSGGLQGSMHELQFCDREIRNVPTSRRERFRLTKYQIPPDLLKYFKIVKPERWLLRNAIVWHKPNAMPSSVKDRLTCTYETIFHFVKNREYYYDLDAIREPHSTGTFKRILQKNVFQQNGGKKQVKLRGKKRSPRDRGSRCGDMVKSLAEKYAKHNSAVGRKYRVGDGYRQGMDRDESELIEKRPNLPKAEELIEYLRKWKGSWTYRQIDKAIGREGDTSSHWFTHRDSEHGFSYPSVQEWLKLKELLGFDETFDKQMTEVVYETNAVMPKDRIRFTKHDLAVGRVGNFNYSDPLHTKEYHLKGKNPGDVISNERIKQNLAHFVPRGSGGHYTYGGLNSKEAKHHADLGKNPGDVMQPKYPPHEPRHFQLLRMDIPHGGHTGKTVRHDNPLGKNPGDVVKAKWTNVSGQSTQGNFGHGGTHGNRFNYPLGKNPGDTWQTKKESYVGNNPHRMRLTEEKYIALNPARSMDLSHPKGKNPGDIIRIGMHHGSSLTSGRATHHEGQIIESHPLGKSPGDVLKIKKRIGDAHKGEATAGLYLPHKTHHELGRNPRDVMHLDRDKTAVEDFRTGRSMKLPPEPKSSSAFHPKGKNPGDIIKARQNSSKIMSQSGVHRYHSRTGIHQEGINLGRYRYAKSGKNPGDVIKQFDEMMKKHPTHPPHHAPRTRLSDWNPHEWMQHPLGKNPGDIVLERGFKGGKVKIKGAWLNDICPNCGGTYRRHFGVQSGRTAFIPCSLEGSNPGDFWSISTKPFKGPHFAVYPEEICIKPIKSSCPPDGIVLDPMCGSGTTLIVAKKLGRKYIGFDINPNYVEMAKKRLSGISNQ